MNLLKIKSSSEKHCNQPRIGYARDMARKLLREAVVKTMPVDLIAVISHLQQDHAIKLVGWDFPERVDGIQITEGTTATIGFNNRKHIHRQRFTIAHEIGHFVLGHTRDDSLYDLDSEDSNEVEANQFAAELLIPLSFLKKSLKSCNGSCDAVALNYWVSVEALWWKIKSHNLLNLLSSPKSHQH